MAGLTEGQRQRVAADRRRSSGQAGSSALMDRLAQIGAGPAVPAVTPPGVDLGINNL
jgi:hypothetical protein